MGENLQDRSCKPVSGFGFSTSMWFMGFLKCLKSRFLSAKSSQLHLSCASSEVGNNFEKKFSQAQSFPSGLKAQRVGRTAGDSYKGKYEALHSHLHIFHNFIL